MNEIVRAVFEILKSFDPKRIFTTIYNNLQQFLEFIVFSEKTGS